MNLQELKKRYESVPQSLRLLKRWVCFKLVGDPTPDDPNHKRKTPKAPFVEKDINARADDPTTWGYFDDALKAMIANGYDGIGLEFGMETDDPHIFGVDLDYHPERGQEVTLQRFNETLNEFDKALNTYVEYSPSGQGFHFFCFGTIPEGRRRNENKAKELGSVEIYPYKRFFTVTGKPYGTPKSVEERTKEIIPLWEKYVDDSEEKAKAALESQRKREEWLSCHDQGELLVLDDQEIIRRASSGAFASAHRFSDLWNGDLNICEGDHSKADLALCNYLAFFTNKNAEQMDRIFRQSALIRDKWDSARGDSTYGANTIQLAIKGCTREYRAITRRTQPSEAPVAEKMAPELQRGEEDPASFSEAHAITDPVMNIETASDGHTKLIFRVDKFKPGQKYPLTDTGNAMRFYDLFGSEFHYNATDKAFMFWTGKTWVRDTKNYIREYANEFVRLLSDELKEERKQLDAETDENKKKLLKAKYEAYEKNWNRLSNKAGKDAMLSELQSLKAMPVESSEFNSDPYLLNTDSGVVDLKTGSVMDFQKELMMASNTNVKVSFDEPTEWAKFLKGIFSRSKAQETEEIIECFQRCIGYTLTGTTSESVMFLLYGNGSNGKSVLAGALQDIMGDYFGSIDSSQLMVNKNQSVAVQNSLAELMRTRYLVTQETDEGERMSEKLIKQMTGGRDTISAQKKYGTPFSFRPTFKIWMMTNHKPHIIGSDYGIWRRLFLFPFEHIFKDEEKDIHMPEKLIAEYPKILGWCIKGCLKYLSKEDGGFKQPACLKVETKTYQDENDVVAEFLKSECDLNAKNNVITKNDMYDAYKYWCKDNNDYCMKERSFRDEMKKKGFDCERDSEGWYYHGIKLFNPHNNGGYYPSSAKSSRNVNDWDD